MKNLLLIAFLFSTSTLLAQDEKHVLASFIKNNPDKSAAYIVHNGEVITDINSDRSSPLASTVKIIIAIEYATQAGVGKIDPQMMVDTADLNHYYVPNTDGGAQPNWISLMKKEDKIKDGKLPLEEVAKGMINFSSNANTEYLLDLLGLDNVNAQLEKLGLQQHSKLYYFISALGIIDGKTGQELKQIPVEEYITRANEIHQKMKADAQYRMSIDELSVDAQKVWSDRLPASTPKEYTGIMKKINSRTFFNQATQKHIDIVMEGILANPVNRTWLKHAGMKGGSTLWVLTKAVYATTTDGETFEFAYFFNNLTIQEFAKLQQHLNKFELAILTDQNNTHKEVLDILNDK